MIDCRFCRRTTEERGGHCTGCGSSREWCELDTGKRQSISAECPHCHSLVAFALTDQTARCRDCGSRFGYGKSTWTRKESDVSSIKEVQRDDHDTVE